MARKSPAEKLEDLLLVTRAWEMLRPARSFFGHTLERFKQAIQPSLDARAEIEDLQGRLRITEELQTPDKLDAEPYEK